MWDISRKANFLGGKPAVVCFPGDYAFGKELPPIKNPVKIGCQNCGREIWITGGMGYETSRINLCEPCYLMTFRGYVRQQAYPERN